MEINQPKGITPKMRGHKLRNGLNWQQYIKAKRPNTRPWCIYCVYKYSTFI